MKAPTLLDKIVAAIGDAVRPVREEVTSLRGEVTVLHGKVNNVTGDVSAINRRVQAMPIQAPALKLCKNCQHCIAEKGWFLSPTVAGAICGRANPKDSKYLVTGVGHEYCNVERSDYTGIDTCGRAGRYFEPRV